MTGIERLRDWAGTMRLIGLAFAEDMADALESIADQIDRERACDADTVENVRLIVGGVVDEMERHVSGVEGMDDSPVARWSRELRGALGGEERDPAILLPQEDRDAIAWVREHGGIGGIERTIASLNDHVYRRQRQIDESHAALRRRNERIAFLVSELNRAYNENHEEFMCRAGDYTAFADEVCKRFAPVLRYVEGCSKDVMDAALNALDRRLMPEGHEWPRFEDGEPVRIGDQFSEHGGCENVADSIEIGDCWFKIHGFDGAAPRYSKGASVKRPAKVLDADGVEIRKGDTVWHVHDLDEFTVTNPNNGENLSVSCKGEDGKEYCCYPKSLTHRAPVLAADGRPLHEGEHVWHVETGTELVVKELPKPGEYQAVVVFAPPASHLASFDPDQLTHERPEIDSWEWLEEDARMDPCEYCVTYGLCAAYMGREAEEFAKAKDLVRRAKALAGGA